MSRRALALVLGLLALAYPEVLDASGENNGAGERPQREILVSSQQKAGEKVTETHDASPEMRLEVR